MQIFSVRDGAEPGDEPKLRLVSKHTLRYHERTVGLNRHFINLGASIQVAYVLRCPMLRDVSTQDIAIPNDGAQYRITQIQFIEREQPPMMDLTLEKVVERYENVGVGRYG